ncbi:PP_RS20740 family protein [Sphingomonas glaciei]|uniref:Uncharacterized protein n=1 Tax=Sphingomonas glaciei TaxID=2938948 RepID=A0ABY5MUX2_9SPHN|nr:hypothetical protein [Sphingomonas glaciei]UUR08285.1 hypothetical protein M1K48_01150 [Sphingomonas glaciei]
MTAAPSDETEQDVPQEEEYDKLVFGTDANEPSAATSISFDKRQDFMPWHHPVKQIVRDYQWGEHAERLIRDFRKPGDRQTLRYFTLPGPDLLDVRYLSEKLSSYGVVIEYFGFDTGYADATATASESRERYLLTEAALRQSGKVSDKAEILSDRLEDIAVDSSQAANRLNQHDTFDVVNIDACDHLGYLPQSRTKSIFDALEVLLLHQLRARKPWMLFVTTRANHQLLGGPMSKVVGAVQKNIDVHEDAFAGPLADCIGGSLLTFQTDLMACWTKQNDEFLKLYSVALGKYLLQYYHSQTNLPAHVELVSVAAYKVATDEPDMLSLAFRIDPKPMVAQPAMAAGSQILSTLELSSALKIVEKASKLWNLDDAISLPGAVRDTAIEGTRALLEPANYDLPAWEDWLGNHPVRPIEVRT